MVVNAKVIPRIGLGMAALGRPGYINLDRSTQIGEDRVRDVAYMQEKANHVLDKAMEIGVTHFDCARSYGLSEKFVGDYLRSKKVSPGELGERRIMVFLSASKVFHPFIICIN